MHLVKNSTRLLEKQLARRTDLHAATKAIEELETDLPFQILNLSRQRRLSHPQTQRGAAEVFLFSNRYEVAKMTQLHSDTLSRLV